jgi:hypothetical protein
MLVMARKFIILGLKKAESANLFALAAAIPPCVRQVAA